MVVTLTPLLFPACINVPALGDVDDNERPEVGVPLFSSASRLLYPATVFIRGENARSSFAIMQDSKYGCETQHIIFHRVTERHDWPIRRFSSLNMSQTETSSRSSIFVSFHVSSAMTTSPTPAHQLSYSDHELILSPPTITIPNPSSVSLQTSCFLAPNGPNLPPCLWTKKQLGI